MDDSGDDRQPKAVAVPVVAAGGAEPLKRLEEPADLGGRDHRAGVGHRKDGAALAGAGGELDPAPGDVVTNGVVD